MGCHTGLWSWWSASQLAYYKSYVKLGTKASGMSCRTPTRGDTRGEAPDFRARPSTPRGTGARQCRGRVKRRGAVDGSHRVHPARPCSSGRSPLSRIGIGRRSRSARGARPPCTSMCAALFCCPFSRGALIPLLRSPSSASDGPSGEAAGMEANKRRLTLDLASTLQRWLKVWRSRASACSGAVKPPSTGRPTKGEADTRFSAAPCAIANTRWERLPGDMLSVPG